MIVSLIRYIKHLDIVLPLVDFVLQVGNKTLINVNAKGKASWVAKVKGFIGFICNSLKTVVLYLIENCFFAAGNITPK